MTLTLTLPLPHRCLSPNARTHWGKKASLTKAARHRARLTVLEELQGRAAPAFTTYSLEFFHSIRRARDDDNAAASCKAYRDGIAEALGVDDSSLSHRATTLSLDPINPRLEITLHP